MATGRRSSTAFYRGEEGRARADEELARQKERQAARKEAGNAPFRFRIKAGDTTEMVVLDDEPGFFRHEHNLQNPQTKIWDIYTGCTAEWDNCPVCTATGRDPYYAMYLTVLDFTPFETRDKQVVEFSRKLLVVKPAQQKKFIRAYNKAVKEGRTLRGAVFEVTRDSDTDSAIGNDIELVDYMDEDELATYTRTWTDRDKKKHTEDCSIPYEYEKLFEEPDSDKLRAIVGGEPSIGSREYERRAGTSRSGGSRGRDRDSDDDRASRGRDSGARPSRRGRSSDDGDDAGYEPASRSERMGRGSRGRSSDSDNGDGDGDEAEDRQSRRSSRSRGRDDTDDAPPPRASRRGRTSDRDGDGDGDEAEDRPARGSRTSRASRNDEDGDSRSRGSTRRSRPANDDPDEDDDNPPGTSGRRVSVRGRR